jgi:hypothetical protein
MMLSELNVEEVLRDRATKVRSPLPPSLTVVEEIYFRSSMTAANSS